MHGDEPPATLYAPRHLILPFATLSDFARTHTRHRAHSLKLSIALARSHSHSALLACIGISIARACTRHHSLALAQDRTRTHTTMSRDTTYTQSSWYAYGRHVIVLHVIVFGWNGFPSE